MAILDNYNRSATGAWKFKRGSSQEETMNVPYTRQMLYRSGTGRRRKPADLENTAYERKSVTYRVPRGRGTQIDPRYPSSGLEWTGVADITGFWNASKLGCLQWDGSIGNSYSKDIAALRAMSKFNRRDMDLGAAWAERGKTADLVRGVATTGVEALNAIRRKDGRGLLNALGLDHDGARGRGVVDAYLAYHYGMKPLLQDVAGAVNVLTRLPNDQWAVRCVGRQSATTVRKGQYGQTSYISFFCSSQFSDRANAVITAIPRPLSRGDDLRWATGLDNPLGTAWELTPYSFVVDWITPVGDWLSALNSFKYYTGWQGCYTQIMRELCTFGGSSHILAGVDCRTVIDSGLYSASHMIRSLVSGLPLLGLPVKDPTSLDHMAKALALLASKSASAGELPRFIRY